MISYGFKLSEIKLLLFKPVEGFLGVYFPKSAQTKLRAEAGIINAVRKGDNDCVLGNPT